MALRFATDSSPFLIAGPCVVESDDLNVRVGEALAELAVKLGITVIYKASYDKANRSRLNAPRGPGLETGLRALEKVRSATALPIFTDVHARCEGDMRPLVDVGQNRQRGGATDFDRRPRAGACPPRRARGR